MMSAPKITVQAVELYERDVTLRLPFRFGVVTLTAAPQAFVRARIRTEAGVESWGASADLLAPKWFDKNAALTNEQNFEQLRDAVRSAARAYTSDQTARTAFDHCAAHYTAHLEAGAKHGLNPLVASFGPALLDRAVFDALLRSTGLSFATGTRANLAGMRVTALTPDLAGFDINGFLGGLTPVNTLGARHTVGLVDPLVAADVQTALNDGLPETLEQVIAHYGQRYFKLKVGGDLASDIDRLERIAAVLDRAREPYVATFDGNEQYDDIDAVIALWVAMKARPALDRLCRSIPYIEQPIRRSHAMQRSVARLAAEKPLIIDESDGQFSDFPDARALGYSGVSSKVCKGFYKSLLNTARCALWNSRQSASPQSAPRFFMSAEDLTCQAGLAVQQDLALVAMIGVDHVERNGHHYVNGFASTGLGEQRAFAAAHPDLYHLDAARARLRIENGVLKFASLDCAGFGSGAMPDWSNLRQIAVIAAH